MIVLNPVAAAAAANPVSSQRRPSFSLSTGPLKTAAAAAETLRRRKSMKVGKV